MPSVSTGQQWTLTKEQLRRQLLNELVLRGQGHKWAEAKTRVEWLDVLPGKGYRIKCLRYEVVPGLWIPALLYEPEKLAAKGTNSGVKYLVFGMRPNPEVGRIDPEVPKALSLELQLIDGERAADA